MQVFDNEHVIAFDVDQTLVMWTGHHNQPGEGLIPFNDPYDDKILYLKPHQKHIDFLRRCKGRNMCVMVWSAGGAQWAKTVVNTLGLSDYVDLIITKPSKFVDDLQADDVLGQRVYLNE